MTSLPIRQFQPRAGDPNPPTTPFSDHSLAALQRGFERMDGRLVKRHLPTPRDLDVIQTHIEDLKFRLTSSASQAEIAVELAKLLTAFPAQAQSSAGGDMRVNAYYDGLIGLPLWAIRQAREKVVKGETSLDTRFAPTPPQFAMLARNMMVPAQRDLDALESIARRADPVEPSPVEKNRVAAGFAKLSMELGAKRSA